MKNSIVLTWLFCLFLISLNAQTQMGLDIDGEAANDYSGTSVALSADCKTVAIGASQNDGAGGDSGHVRVYELNGSNMWVQKGTDIDGSSSGIWSGSSVAISDDGNTVAIGAIYKSYSGLGSAGQVRVFRFVGGVWTLLGTDITGAQAFDYAGTSVSLSDDGNTVAIGAPSYSSYPGSARVFTYNGTNWTQKGVTINGAANNDHFGTSVYLSDDGNTLAVGAYRNDATGTDGGHVRLYTYSGTSWVQKGADINSEAANDWAGYSVSLSDNGNRVIIGAPQNDGSVSTGIEAGQARIYQYSAGVWSQMGQDLDGEDGLDSFGRSVSISGDGNIVAVGAIQNDGTTGVFGDNRGHVRVFQFDGTLWTQVGVDIDGEATFDWSGHSVCLSDDGSAVAIGALNNNAFTGHTRVYKLPVCAPNYIGGNQLIGTEMATADYETDGSIESIQTIDATAIIDYDSKVDITLQPGFETIVGACFHAFIDGCQGLY